MANKIAERFQEINGGSQLGYGEAIGQVFTLPYKFVFETTPDNINTIARSIYYGGNTVESKIADIQRKRQIEQDRIDKQNQEQIKKAAEIERKNLEEQLKKNLDILAKQSDGNVEQKLMIAQKYKEQVDAYKKAEKTGNSSDYIVARSFDPISGQPLAKQDLPKHPAGFTEYLPNGSQKTYDGNGNYSVGVKGNDGIMVFSQLTPTGQAPIWSPMDQARASSIQQTQQFLQPAPTTEQPKTETPTTEQTKTEQPTQLPANVYKTGSGYIKDSTPIPEVLQGGKILPHQYFTQNGINMSDRANLAVKMGILKDASEWQGTAGQNYALVDALEKQKKGATTEQPTTQPTEQAGKPGDWIADAPKKETPKFEVQGKIQEKHPYDLVVPARFTDSETRNMLEKLSPEERTKKIQEFDFQNVKAQLENAINNSDISTINQILGTTYHQGNERERMDELPMILTNARMKLNSLTPEDASAYMGKKDASVYNTARTLAKDTSPRLDPGRQAILSEIAKDPSLLGTKYQTTISPEEQQYMNSYQANERKNVMRNSVNQFLQEYNTALKESPDSARQMLKQWKSTFSQMEKTNPEFKALIPELKQQMEGVKVTPTKTVAKKTYEVKPGKVKTFEMTPGAIPQPPEIKAPEPKTMQLGGFEQVNTGNAPTLANRIETSNIAPNNPQALGLEKNPIRRN